MSNLNKDDLYNRGWTDDKVKYLLNSPYILKDNIPLWESYVVERIENTISYKNFIDAESYCRALNFINTNMLSKTDAAINKVNELNVNYKHPDNLLSNLDKYDSMANIVHFPIKNFKSSPDKSYSLFTDGCFKNIGKEAFSTCAGWILENETQTIIAEFSSTIALDENKTRSMPEFELIGIYEGVKIINQLGLKNVQCYTDSVGEANMIFSALNGIGEKRIQSNSHLYDSIIDTLSHSNSTISWIPRDYNIHADKLTKIHLHTWYENYKKEYIEKDYFAKNGYVVNKDIDIFFHNTPNIIDEDNPLTLFNIKAGKDEDDCFVTLVNVRGIKHKVKDVVNLLCIHNGEDNSLDIIHHQSKDDFLEMQSIGNKKMSISGAVVMNFVMGLKILKDCPNLNIEVTNGMYAIMKNLAPISNVLQEEYFELHKAIQEFPGKIKIKKMPLQRLHELSEMINEEGFGIRKKSKNKKK